jgi:hypothetical protein
MPWLAGLRELIPRRRRPTFYSTFDWLHYKMERHRSGLRSVSPICVTYILREQIAMIDRDELSHGGDTDGRLIEGLSLLSVSLNTLDTRSVSDWPDICDTDRLFVPQVSSQPANH